MALPSKGLVLHLSMREGAGTFASDASRYHNDGALTGCKWVENGLEFNGSSDYIACGNDESLNITDAITISLWIYPTKSQPWRGIISKPNNYILKYTGDGLKPVFSADLTVGGIFTLSSLEDAPLNKYSCVVGTYNSNGSGANIYITGRLSNSDGGLAGNWVIRANNLAIGALSDGPTHLSTGSISDVRIMNRALSAAEIKRAYKREVHNYK